MTDTVLTYRGRPITDLTKDELVDAMTWAFLEIEHQRERADRYLQTAACRPKPLILEERKAESSVEPEYHPNLWSAFKGMCKELL